MLHQTLKQTKTSNQTTFVFECTFFNELGHENYSKKFTKEVTAVNVVKPIHHVFLQPEEKILAVNTG